MGWSIHWKGNGKGECGKGGLSPHLMKKYRFWFHYNKPESRKTGKPVMTVHYRDRCIMTNSIECNVATETHHRKRQPHIVIRGWAGSVGFMSDGLIVIK